MLQNPLQMAKCIIFDFDGTLADTSAGIVAAVKETFRRLGWPIPDEEKIRPTIGLVLEQSMQCIGNLTLEQSAEACRVYREIFPEYGVSASSLFPEVVQTLAYLHSRGIRMAIATSRGRDSLKMLIAPYGIDRYFEDMVTSTDGLKPKPAPDPVLALLARMNQPAADTLVVGDTTFDILMGAGAGCRTCGVTYGNQTETQLRTASPDYIVDRFEEIAALV